MFTPQQALQRLLSNNELFHDEMTDLMRQIMRGEVAPELIAAILIGLRIKVETVSEISAAAHAYLSALYRGDGETAWRYAFVPYNPQQNWWDERTAKGALLMKAGSNEYFAGEKQGVSQIQIAPQSIRQQGNAASLNARIIYGNGTSSDLNLKMMNQGGKWLVPQE